MPVLLLLLLGLAVHAQPPAIRQNGAVNAASRIPSALIHNSIARRSQFTIEGVRLGSARGAVRVLLEHGKRSIVLSTLSVQPRRIDAWMRADAPLGEASLSVETPQGRSKPFSIKVARSEPGLFSVNGEGWGPAKILPATGVEPGQIVKVSGTGFGSGQKIEIAVGGHAAEVLGFLPARRNGADSIRFRVPSEAPRGCFVPLYARVSGEISNTVTIPIAGHNSDCQMPANWPWPNRGKRLGIVGISRSMMLPGSNQPTITVDEAFASFSNPGHVTESSRPLLLPPGGTCTAYTEFDPGGLGELGSVPAPLAGLGDGPTLDAGPRFTIAGSSGTREIPRSGIYWTRLGSENPASRRNLPLFLNDPRYTFSVPGGRDIAGLSGTIPGIPHFEWINRGALASIDRLRGAAVQWRGVPKDAIVLILAASFDPASTAGGIAYCAAKNGADRFFIPPEILAHFPATGRAAGPARSGVAVIALRLKSGPSIAGADPVRLVSVSVSAREAEFR